MRKGPSICPLATPCGCQEVNESQWDGQDLVEPLVGLSRDQLCFTLCCDHLLLSPTDGSHVAQPGGGGVQLL